MAPAQPWQESLPFVDDNIDILASLFGDDDSEGCSLSNDDDFGNVFETFVSDVAQIENPPSLLHESDLASHEMPLVSLPPSVPTVSSSQSLYRQRAISRWRSKRERRVFVKKVSTVKSSSHFQKTIPNRSGSNGRFVKSTLGFISITQAQSAETNSDADSCLLFVD